MSDAGTAGNAGNEVAAAAAVAGAPPRWTLERLLSVHHWTDKLLSFRISRPAAYRFTPGHYARRGLGSELDGIEWRPFSIVSTATDDFLEFFAVRVPAGAFSDRLVKASPGDPIRIEKASYGFLTLSQLAPGKDLWLLASGTGLGPFVAILRDAAVWRAFERIIVVHSVRIGAELAYRSEIAALAAATAAGHAKLSYIPVVTREAQPGALSARIPQLLEDGSLAAAAGAELDKQHSRIMVCGNPELVKTLRATLGSKGYQVARRGQPGQMAFEKYW